MEHSLLFGSYAMHCIDAYEFKGVAHARGIPEFAGDVAGFAVAGLEEECATIGAAHLIIAQSVGEHLGIVLLLVAKFMADIHLHQMRMLLIYHLIGAS